MRSISSIRFFFSHRVSSDSGITLHFSDFYLSNTQYKWRCVFFFSWDLFGVDENLHWAWTSRVLKRFCRTIDFEKVISRAIITINGRRGAFISWRLTFFRNSLFLLHVCDYFQHVQTAFRNLYGHRVLVFLQYSRSITRRARHSQ